ncbi:DsbA family protein [Streptomyces iakyrus]|uniref:DsbA family protein n=1 Tax=Streptomyces iakyrus TaxID=68219 RepID=UPI0033BD65C8
MGRTQDRKESAFCGYAKQLGLGMKKFDTALADPEVAGHVQDDRRDGLGLGLGVQGTPTFFFDGKMVATPGSYEAFKTLIDDRLSD